MIYRNSFFDKERKRAYMEQGASSRRTLAVSMFVAVLTFSLHMVLQTLTESVLSTALPEFMQKSYFSVASLYVQVGYVVYTVYFMAYYEYLTFAEIRRNKWYTPEKLGFSPTAMIFAKLLARIWDVLILYTVGYVGAVLLASFLKYPYVPAYLIQLYIAGLLDMILIVLVSMTCSLFTSKPRTARLIIVMMALVLYVARITTGYYAILSERNIMLSFTAAARLMANPYPWYGLTVAAVCIATCIVMAKRTAMYEAFDFYRKDHDYASDVKLITGGMKLEGSEAELRAALRRGKIVNVLTNCLLGVIIAALLAFNGLVLMMSVASPNNESSPIGVIPFVFQSNMMEPEIMYNDLAVFQVVDAVSPLSLGDVVMFKYGGEPYVARVTEIDGTDIKTDIDYYPEAVKEEAYARNTTRERIYGRLSYVNRWLGALVLFANTTIGRLLMLILPCVLIFFYKPISEFLARLSRGGLKE